MSGLSQTDSAQLSLLPKMQFEINLRLASGGYFGTLSGGESAERLEIQPTLDLAQACGPAAC
jgi:hypothetical protein